MRMDETVFEIVTFLREHTVQSVAITKKILGYPHELLAHDPEECASAFRKGHAQSRTQSAMMIQPNLFAL
jgi:hypothetical protein